MRNTSIVVVLVALLAASCGTAEDTGTTTTSLAPGTTQPPVQQGELARADVPRATVTDATEAEVAALVAGDAAFAFDLFRAISAEGGNTFLSPYSIAAALTMTYAGARSTTAEQMADVLRFGVDGDRIHVARNELDLRIAQVPEPVPDDDREPLAIEVANSLWGQYDYPFLEEFLTTLAESYDAGMNLVDFRNAAEEARIAINDWVEENTAGRIEDLIPEGVINSLTRLVLVNAIWFKASWADQFEPEATADATFVTLDGTETTVPFMNGTARRGYLSGDGFELLRMPYAGDASMIVIMPDEGRFGEIVAELDASFVTDALDKADSREVNLAFPKFEFTSEFSLGSVLADLGMSEAFISPTEDSGADFTGITEERELFIQEIVHQAFVKVDETGTEAAAATAVIIGLTAVEDPPIRVEVNRPFVFLIEHSSTGEILFLGQVINPAG